MQIFIDFSIYVMTNVTNTTNISQRLPPVHFCYALLLNIVSAHRSYNKLYRKLLLLADTETDTI